MTTLITRLVVRVLKTHMGKKGLALLVLATIEELL